MAPPSQTAELAAPPGAPSVPSVSPRDVAVIGLAVRAAAADDAAHFWQLVRDGRDGLRALPEPRARDARAYLACLGVPDPDAVPFRRGGWLEQIDRFDHAFFGLSAKEGKLMSPDQRLMLETVYAAVEDAGYAGSKIAGSNTGLYVGWSPVEDYARIFSTADASTPELVITGDSGSIMVGKAAYHLDLKGPAVALDAACASSLLAVHAACRAIRAGECTQAIAAGVRIYFLPTQGSVLPGVGLDIIGGVESPQGRCRTFDHRADGAGIGEGVGAVLLKPLARALQDRDHVYAVIRGSASNQDGRAIGRGAPNPNAQTSVLLAAWRDARISPAELTYIEAHGTGTQLGDPVELRGLSRAFERHTQKRQFCGAGSVKTNVGHLDAASGIVGFIKAVLSLHHAQLPPNLHFERPNHKLMLEASPLYVVDTLTPWAAGSTPRRCGVSAFGMNGSNCHVVLEEAPEALPDERDAPAALLALSARTGAALRALAARYLRFLERQPRTSLADFCFTANTGRAHLAHRVVLPASRRDVLLAALARVARDEADAPLLDRLDDAPARALAARYLAGETVDFAPLYPGQARRRIALPTYPFADTRCWVDHVQVAQGAQAGGQGGRDFAYPAFDLEGVATPDRVVHRAAFGAPLHWLLREHTLGGYGVVPGVVYLDMVAALAGAGQPHTPRSLEAMFVSPCTVAGGERQTVQLVVETARTPRRFLVASQDARGDWTTHAEGTLREAPPPPLPRAPLAALIDHFAQGERIPVASLQKGRTQLGPHWDNIASVHRRGDAYLVRFALPDRYAHELREHTLHPALMDNGLNAIGQLLGSALYLPLSVQRLDVYRPLPATFYSHFRGLTEAQHDAETITFDVDLIDADGVVLVRAERYTIKKVTAVDRRFAALARGRSALCHVLGWEPAPSTPAAASRDPLRGESLLIVADASVRARRIARALPEALVATSGGGFAQIDARTVSVGPTLADYQRLIELARARRVTRVLHLAGLGSGSDTDDDALLPRCLLLVRALAARGLGAPVTLHVVAEAAEPVGGAGERVAPVHAALFGLCRAIAPEYPSLRVRLLDVDAALTSDALLAELARSDGPAHVALRGGVRHVQTFSPLPGPRPDAPGLAVRAQGTYLVTGGLGGIGLEIAHHLSRCAPVRLALLGRSVPHDPERTALAPRLAHALREIEARGSEVLLCRADVSVEHDLTVAFQRIRARWGALHGIVHAAGVAGSGYLIHKTPEDLARVLAPKLAGTRLLEGMSRGDPLDFFVLCSSLASYVGIAGQSDYAAANAYLDAFAHDRRRAGRPVVSIGWAAWSETGMAVNEGALRDDFVFAPLSNEDGMEALTQVLAADVGHVLVGRPNAGAPPDPTLALPASLARRLRPAEARRPAAAARPALRVQVTGTRAGAVGAIEVRLGEIWAALLDATEIDVQQSFQSLGGDSLLATRLFRNIDAVWPGALDIADIFSAPRLRELADRVARTGAAPSPPAEGVDALLEQLASGSITAAEAARLTDVVEE